MGADEQSPTQRRRVESSRVPTRTSPETTPMRLSPAIDSSPPIPIGFLSLTTRSFLPFSLTTPIPIHFSSPYPYPFRFCLVNGEIYNHEDLRKQLTNHTSRTGSDCDVIAHLYVEYELLKGKTLYAFGLVFVYLAICGVIGGVFGLVVVHGVKTSFSWLKCFKVLKVDVYLYKRKKKVSTISALSFH
ncbi:hypothetical protein ACJW31_05G187300 [Castanea mollissima]